MAAPIFSLNYENEFPARCADKRVVISSCVDLFVIVPSRALAFETRSAIRASWAADANSADTRNDDDGGGGDGASAVVVRFVVGDPNDDDEREALAWEFHAYGDLIMTSIRDTYENLYLKVSNGANKLTMKDAFIKN